MSGVGVQSSAPKIKSRTPTQVTQWLPILLGHGPNHSRFECEGFSGSNNDKEHFGKNVKDRIKLE